MTKFICEIGSNHKQDLNHCFELIAQAKEMGCWAIKFQLFKADKLYAPGFKSQIEKMKAWELPEEFIPEIAKFCKILEINFICTPFDLDAVQILKPYVDYYKIGSYENQWYNLIETVAKTGKPWMISAGMIHENKMYKIINNLIKEKAKMPMVILLCNSNYPAKPKNCNLYSMNNYKDWHSWVQIGWSDHTTEPGVVHKAIALGAEFIEFHFGNGPEAAIGHCWKYDDIARVIHDVKIGEIAEENNDTGEEEAKKWRTDPVDGLRPLREYREELLG